MRDSTNRNLNLDRLLSHIVEGTITPKELEELETRLKGNPDAQRRYIQYLGLHADLQDLGSRRESATSMARERRPFSIVHLLGAAAVAAAIVFAAVLAFQPEPETPSDRIVGQDTPIDRTIEPESPIGLILERETPIATVVELSGPVSWTGNAVRILQFLEVGTELAGGTVEGMAPTSWLELKFNDGSTVSISGNSMLSFSNHDQKELHLKSGTLFGNIKPQPKGKPMLIHTRSARLEILGTRFNVETELGYTVLTVNHGKVRAIRLSDDDSVVVPAHHRVIASVNRDFSPEPIPEAVYHWKSELQREHSRAFGKWIQSAKEAGRAVRKRDPLTNLSNDFSLWAIPYKTEEQTTIYTTAIPVSRGDNPPVTLKPTSQIRVRGYLGRNSKLYFGVTVRHPDGVFAGRFQITKPASEFQSDEEFEVLLQLRDYRLDPSLSKWKRELPENPFELIVESLWCHSLYKPVRLAVTEMEIRSPAEAVSEQATH